MTTFRYTVVADGPSDRCLLPIIDSIVSEISPVGQAGLIRQFAWPLPPGPLVEKVHAAVRDFPCDVLFVHRDAERESLHVRLQEIENALGTFAKSLFIPVVPVRMTEAWLLIDEQAIRRAADNPNGKVTVAMPRLGDLEALPDPKLTLYTLLKAASEKRGRRLQQFGTMQSLTARRARVANLIADFTPLRRLPAFAAFRERSIEVLSLWSSQSQNVK